MRSYQQIKQINHKQIRRDYLQEKFKTIRRDLSIQNQIADEQMFVKLIANTEKSNYQQNKALLKNFSYRDENSFRLLGLIGLAYQYLIQCNHWDEDSIQILRNCSQYQEIQIPQTKQFSLMLIQWLRSDTVQSKKKSNTDEGLSYYQDAALDIILLLFRCHQYTPILRNLLFQQGLLIQLETIIDLQIMLLHVMQQEESEEKLRQQTDMQFKILEKQNTILQSKFTFNRKQHNVTSIIICDICCCAFTEMPLFQEQTLEEILKFIGKIIQHFPESIFIVCDAIFSKINSTFKPNYNIARMVLNRLHSLVIDIFYFENIDHCLDFFSYATRSSLQILDQSKQKLLVTISTNQKIILKKKAIFILHQCLKQPEMSQNSKFDLSELMPMSMLGNYTKKPNLQEIERKKQLVKGNYKFFSQEKNVEKILQVCTKNIELRKQCLEIFGLLLDFSQDSVEEIINCDYLFTEDFIFMIKDCLLSTDNSLIIQALTIMNSLLSAEEILQSNELLHKKISLVSLTEDHLKPYIQQLQLKSQNQQVTQQCDTILNLIQENSKNDYLQK